MTEVMVAVVLDESGSMDCVRQETIDGYNAYIDELQRSNGSIRVSLTQFNSFRVHHEYMDKPISEVPKLDHASYRPDGMTPLYDAIGSTIREVEDRLEEARARPAVLFVVLTDGLENYSREFTLDNVSEMIRERQTEKGWTFAYLGANQDAWETGRSMGYRQGNVANYDAAAPDKAFGLLAVRTVSYVGAAATASSPKAAYTESFFGTDADSSEDTNARPKDGEISGSGGPSSSSEWQRKPRTRGRKEVGKYHETSLSDHSGRS